MKWKKYLWVSFWPEASNQVSAHGDICLEEDVVRLISRLLFSSWPSWYLNKMILSIMSLRVVRFILKRTYGFGEETAWRIPRRLLNAWPPLISEWNDLSNSGSPFCLSSCSRWYMVWKKDTARSPEDSCHGGTTQWFCRLWVYNPLSNALQT